MEGSNPNVLNLDILTKQSVITVVMAVYNAEQYIHRSIQSVQAQTYKDWKMICVNDGSTDNTLDILCEYALRDTRISYITKENGGPASARAVAYEKLTTPYAIMLDADDIYTEDLLENLVKIAQEKRPDCIAPNLLIEQSDGSYMDWNTCYHWREGDVISGKEAFSKCFVGASLHGVNLWNSDLLRKYATGDNANYNQFNEDEYIQRLLFINSKEVFFSNGSYIYTRNNKSITKGLPLKHLGYLSTCRKYIELIDKYHIGMEIANSIKEYYLRHIIALQIRLYKNMKGMSREHYHIMLSELKKAYSDAIRYRDCCSFKDKRIPWIYKYAATSNYRLFCFTTWIFSFCK